MLNPFKMRFVHVFKPLCMEKLQSAFQNRCFCNPYQSRTFRIFQRQVSNFPDGKTVNLSHIMFQPEKPDSSPPVLILHGLLGSKQNWRGLGKAIAVKTNRKVYTLDARNHGDSPHSDEFTYPLMAEDVKYFMQSHHIEKSVLIGHSMGGRTAMHIALTEKSLVDKLVVVDVSPLKLPKESSSSMGYMREMQEALKSIPELTLVQARKAIDEYLSKKIPDVPIRQFLLTNLTEKDRRVLWKPNLDTLLYSFESGITNFPQSSSFYPEECLFICGGDSPYVNPDDQPKIKVLFPKAEFIRIPNAGHWVHSEKPSEFLEALSNVL